MADKIDGFTLKGTRWHCSRCSWSTTLPNKAVNHWRKKHNAGETAKAAQAPAKSASK